MPRISSAEMHGEITCCIYYKNEFFGAPPMDCKEMILSEDTYDIITDFPHRNFWEMTIIVMNASEKIF